MMPSWTATSTPPSRPTATSSRTRRPTRSPNPARPGRPAAPHRRARPRGGPRRRRRRPALAAARRRHRGAERTGRPGVLAARRPCPADPRRGTGVRCANTSLSLFTLAGARAARRGHDAPRAGERALLANGGGMRRIASSTHRATSGCGHRPQPRCPGAPKPPGPCATAACWRDSAPATPVA